MKTCPTCHAIYPTHFAVCPRDAAPLAKAEGWTEGTVIRGKYRIVGKVGQGGMGAVYKALHVKFDQLRALKVMSQDMAADPDFVKRFEREAVLMSRLKHPNVVRVDDIDETEDGCPFIVMEFVAGRSLRQLIQQEGPLAPLRVCSIAKQVAAGLEAAHLLGMVHRDIKPDNIVLLPAGDSGRGEAAPPTGEMGRGEAAPRPYDELAKVLDFGIAKLKEARLGDGLRTATGVIIGTPQYLSPEQAMGKRSDELDGRSDLYSLGLVMYQMLVCDLPFKADSAAGWMLARVQNPPTPIRAARPDLAIPEPLAKLVMRCLEKDRDLRPANARELIGEIERVEEEIRRPPQTVPPPVATVPAPAPPPVTPSPVAEPRAKAVPRAISTARWARGWRVWAGLAVTVLLPVVLWPLFDLTPYAYPRYSFPAYAVALIAAVGALGWWLLTRQRWALRLTALLPLALFALVLSGRISIIYSLVHHAGAGQAEVPTRLYTIQELKQANRSPVEALPATREIENQTSAVIFKLVFQNISSDVVVTDWKTDVIDFDDQGKFLSETQPVNQTPMLLEPGKSYPMQLSGADLAKVKTIKVVFKEVDYDVRGTEEKGSWINPHFQEDVEKAKQH